MIAPDYRGAGRSSKPPQGYDKRTMAADIAALLTDVLGVDRAVTVVGNDIGIMVAYTFGSQFPDLVERLVLMEAVLPGTVAYDRVVGTHQLSGAPISSSTTPVTASRRLTEGRERLYLRHFYDRHAFDPEASADLDRYADDFSVAVAMRAGFEIYRTFDQDLLDNRTAPARTGRLRTPVLALGCETSFYSIIAAGMLVEFVEDVTVSAIPRCGHWIPEENPAALLEHILQFTGRS